MKKTVFLMLVIMAFFGFSSAMAADEIYSATTSGVLSLHISPDEESYTVATVPACSKMELIEEDKTWGLVKINNKCGWVNLSFTRNSYDDAAEATGTDAKSSIKINGKDGKATIYNIPSTERSFGSLEQYRIPNGTVLKITRETSSGWGLVSMNGIYSWVKMEDTIPFIESLDTDKYGIFYVYVLSDGGRGLSLWSDRWRSRRYAVIPDCVRLTVQETDGDYALVAYNGINGWIELRQTAESLLNAQSAAGKEVNREYLAMPLFGEEKTQVLTVPSENSYDGGRVVATIDEESEVFVLRSTMNGWGLIYYDGALGWVPSEALSPLEEEHSQIISMLERPIKGYVSTQKRRGMTIFASPDGKKKITTIPEFVQISVIAQKDGYEFISCDYACGWAKMGEYLQSAENIIPDEEQERLIVKAKSPMMSLPTMQELCNSEQMGTVERGTIFDCILTVTTEKERWAFAEIDGQTGWINMEYTQKVMPLYLAIAILLGIIGLICCIVYAVRLLKKKKEGEHQDETQQRLCYAGSGAQEKSPDVSGE